MFTRVSKPRFWSEPESDAAPCGVLSEVENEGIEPSIVCVWGLLGRVKQGRLERIELSRSFRSRGHNPLTHHSSSVAMIFIRVWKAQLVDYSSRCPEERLRVGLPRPDEVRP